MSSIVYLPFTDTYSLSKARNMVGKDFFTISNCSVVAGVIGKALNFNGSNSYVYGDVRITPEMTFALWVNFATTSAVHIIDCRSNDAYETGYQPFYGGPSYGIQFYNSDTGSVQWGSDVCGFTTNVWYHLAMVITPDYCELFINGVSKGKRFNVWGSNHGVSQMRIGTRCSGANWLKGKVNGVRVYNHALTDFEIDQISKQLVLHYSFDDMYEPTECICLTGGQYFDTGIVPTNAGFKVQGDVKPWDSTGKNLCIAGCGNSIWNGPIMMNLCNGKMEFGVAGYVVSSAYTVNLRQQFSLSYSAGNTTVNYSTKLNDVETNSGSKTFPTTSNSLYIGTFNHGTVSPNTYYQGMIFGIYIVNGSDYYEFLPYIRKTDGVAGLYDKKRGIFLTNKGSGNVVAFTTFGHWLNQNCSVDGNTLTYSKSSIGWGDCGFNSSESYDRVYVSARPSQTSSYIMIGLAPNQSYEYKYGWFMYASADGTIIFYENDIKVGSGGTYQAGDEFKVVYDGMYIRYYHNGNLLRSTAYNGKMYVNINCYSTSGAVHDVKYGQLEDVLDAITIPDDSGNGYRMSLDTASAFNVSTDTNLGIHAIRNISGNPAAIMRTGLDPSFITSGTIAFWYKKDASALDYNNGNFLVATQNTAGSWIGASSDSDLPFNSGSSYQKFYIDGVQVTGGSSNKKDTDWHFYVFTGVNLQTWSSFAIHSHGDSSWLYRGNISDFKIYNTSLSAEDIDILYKQRTVISKGMIACENYQTENYQYYLNNTGTLTANVAVKDYIPLEYITLNGTQYIDTGLLQGLNYEGMRVEAKIRLHRLTTSYICGSHALSDPYKRNGLSGAQDGTWELGYGNTYPHMGICRVNTDYEVDYATFGEEAYVKVKGGDYADWTTLYEVHDAYENAYSGRIYAFSNQYAENNGQVTFTGRCYYLRIYNDLGYCVRDYIPAMRKEDGAIGLYDQQNHVFYLPTKGTFKGPLKALPEDDAYEQLEYLESSGAQFINTGYTLATGSNTFLIDAEVSCSNMNNGVRKFIFGFDNPSYSHYAEFNAAGQYGCFEAYVGSYKSGERYNVRMQINGASTTNFSIDKESVTSTTYQSSAWGTFNLFCLTPSYQGPGVRIHSAKMYWGDGTLRRDYIPVRRKSDGALGMYCLVSKLFQTNSGSGTFIAGPVVTHSVREDNYNEVELWAERVTTEGEAIKNTSDGVIDTQWLFNANTDRIEVTFKSDDTSQNAMIVANSTNDSDHIWMYYYKDTNAISVYVSTDGQDGCTTKPRDNGVHTLVYDGPRKEVRLDASKYGSFSRTYREFTSPLCIFNSVIDSGYTFKGRIYSCKIYRNGRLVRDYRPGYTGVIRGGLYDKVHGAIYTSYKSRLGYSSEAHKKVSDVRSVYSPSVYKHMNASGLTFR